MFNRLKYLILLAVTLPCSAQKPTKLTPSEIYHKVEKLNTLASALYIAAHPDDENTRLITYLSNHEHAETSYLSLTRGNGGQNLISNELGDVLGIIRTQELLNARKIDGGVQYFSTANDFGFSKRPSEAYDKWQKEQILAQVVYTIRMLQPDIIVNRFDHRTEGTTHGHHTASAQLSELAFNDAANSKKFSNQLNQVTTFQPTRLFFNASWWFFGGKEQFAKADKSKYIPLEIGVYYPLLGKSNQEIASLSRSQHQSQGFGDMSSRGSDIDYLELIYGPKLKNEQNLFEGIDTSWNRIKNGKAIGNRIENLLQNFDFKTPENNVNALVEIYSLIQNLENSIWKERKLKEVKDCILFCTGLFFEVSSDNQFISPNETAYFKFELINRSNYPIEFNQVYVFGEQLKNIDANSLSNNEAKIETFSLKVPKNMKLSNAHYLENAENSFHNQFKPLDELNYNIELKINDIDINFENKIIYKFKDEVKGEIYDKVLVVPKISGSIKNKLNIIENQKSQKIETSYKSYVDNFSGKARLVSKNNPENKTDWKEINNLKYLQETHVAFEVAVSDKLTEEIYQLEVISNNEIFDKDVQIISYNHIPTQVLLTKSEAIIKRIEIAKSNSKIAYLMGAGDDIPTNLQNMGYDVDYISSEQISKENLQKYDVVILGIRAFNTINELKFKNEILFDFVSNGGTLINQYNTNHSLVTEKIAPYKLQLSRDRITNEDAEVKFLNPTHPVLNYPNKITQNDFTGWVQEQGLYYASDYDSKFIPILESKDFNDPKTQGILLIAPYGKGHYVYTGLSFFRQLPAGVPGAYKLFANLIALKNETKK